MTRLRVHSLRTGPFWWLIAAWICANIPAAAPLHAFVWLKSASHFSHQADLRQQVAQLLQGHSSDRESPHAIAAKTAGTRMPPAAPASVSHLKKIDLALAATAWRVDPPGPDGSRTQSAVRLPGAPVADVPYLPPRACGLVS